MRYRRFSRRILSHHKSELGVRFKPTSPWKTCTPALRLRAQRVRSFVKLAFSSTTTVTSFLMPLQQRARNRRIRVVRYSVCFMERTCGSCAAVSENSPRRRTTRKDGEAEHPAARSAAKANRHRGQYALALLRTAGYQRRPRRFHTNEIASANYHARTRKTSDSSSRM